MHTTKPPKLSGYWGGSGHNVFHDVDSKSERFKVKFIYEAGRKEELK